MFKVIKTEKILNSHDFNSDFSSYDNNNSSSSFNLKIDENNMDPNKIIFKKVYLNNVENHYLKERVVKKCKKSRNSWSRKEVRN